MSPNLKFGHVVILFVVLSVFSVSCTDNAPSSRDVIDAIPQQSAVLIRINNILHLEEGLKQSALFREVDTLKAIDQFERSLLDIRSLYTAGKGVRNHRIWVSVNLAGADKYGLLFLREAQPIDSIPALFSGGSRAYGEAKIYNTAGESGQWFFARHKGVDMLSREERLIEASLRQLSSGMSLAQNPDFSKALGTVNLKDPFNIILNYNELEGLLKFIFPQSNPLFPGDLGSWSAYDASLKVDALMLNGVHLTPDSANSWLACFSGNSTGDFKAQNLLPGNTAQAVMVQVGNFDQYHRKYMKYLDRNNRLRSYKQQSGELPFNLNETLLSWGGEEFGLISLETSPDAVAQPRVAYISARNADDALAKLKVQSDPNFIDNHRNYLIYKSNAKGLFPLAFGKVFKDIVEPYYTVHKGYILLGNNLQTLKGFINDQIDGRTLVSHPNFNNTVDALSDRGHVRIIHKNPGALGLIQRLVNNESARELKKYDEGLQRIAWSVVQFSTDKEVSYSQVYIKHQEEYIPEAKQLWALKLSAPVAGKPQLVVNHYSRLHEVVVQDQNDFLYLIDHTGKVLWKRSLDGPVMGGISQVDLFKNNKLQLALNTEKSVYIIDRNGVDVSPFPIALPQSATAPMAVFDYDKTRNYRFIVPCGNKVYNFNKEGKKVEGWVFPETETPVLREPQHFSVSGKDFIVIREKSGKIHLVSRRGEIRIESNNPLPDTHNNLYLSIGNTREETRIVTLSEGGKLVSLFMNGSVDSTNIHLDADPAEMLYSDGRYIITQNGHFIVKEDLNPFDIDLDAELSKPLYFVYKEEPLYGVVIPEKDQVWLFDKEGDVLQGLPLYGSSEFTIGEFGRGGVLNLIVGTEDGNLLNYRLE